MVEKFWDGVSGAKSPREKFLDSNGIFLYFTFFFGGEGELFSPYLATFLPESPTLTDSTSRKTNEGVGLS